ncbi:hypothetical protein FHQ08_12195 [Lactobacillus sp. CC-MHH1034]|uniref:phosphopantetheine-binding protein n=1 Tax=Agrilactobacillus fermenti TaxID=2586909 RepID=UPI001E63BCC4|nr:phosphopantetheine-binding protein [Agrilactobacillus fermenti]MCD2257447.1 hypothetical protein [Agrilactobacillus fermenti]
MNQNINKIIDIVSCRELSDRDIMNGNKWLNGLDSLGVVEVIVALEKELGLKFNSEFLKKENFSSIQAIQLTINTLEGRNK